MSKLSLGFSTKAFTCPPVAHMTLPAKEVGYMVNPYVTKTFTDFCDKHDETNACTVVAHSVAFNKSLEQSYRYVAGAFKRIKRGGATYKDIERAFKGLPNVKKLPYRYKLNEVTVGRFIKEHPEGRYYCIVSCHALAIVNGVLWDHQEGLKRRIIMAWKVTC